MASSPASNMSTARGDGIAPSGGGVPMVSELLLPFHPRYATHGGSGMTTPGSGGGATSSFASMFHNGGALPPGLEASPSQSGLAASASARSSRNSGGLGGASGWGRGESVLRSADGSTRVATPLATPRDRSAATSVAGPSRRETWSELGSGVGAIPTSGPWAGQSHVVAAAARLVAAAAAAGHQEGADGGASLPLMSRDSYVSETEMILEAYKKLALTTQVPPPFDSASPRTPSAGGSFTNPRNSPLGKEVSASRCVRL